MLTKNEIQQALHAGRVLPVSVNNPHGPLGLEQLAAAVAQLSDSPVPLSGIARICRSIALSVETWEKLEEIAKRTAPAGSPPVPVSEIAASILEQVTAATP
jgi:hypothetical protein